jgi:hypothetical protein
LPIRRDQAALGDSVDVISQGQGDDIGFQPIDHRAGLLARAIVGLIDPYVLTGASPPIGREQAVEILVELSRRIVADIEQGRRRRGARPSRGREKRRAAGRQNASARKIDGHGFASSPLSPIPIITIG